MECVNIQSAFCVCPCVCACETDAAKNEYGIIRHIGIESVRARPGPYDPERNEMYTENKYVY